MNPTRIRTALLPLLLAGLLPLAGLAAEPAKGPIQRELSAELAEARREVRAELASARAELETENLDVEQQPAPGQGRQWRRRGTSEGGNHSARRLPDRRRGGGHRRRPAQAVAGLPGPCHRHRQGRHRHRRGAQIAIDAVDRGLFSLIVGALTGSLEHKLEKTIKATVEPGVLQICRSLPSLLDSQQRLATSLPQFRPYATLEADDVADCENEVRNEFARR